MAQPHPNEIFAFPHYATGGNAAIVSQGVLIDAIGEYAEATILVPPFFEEIVALEIILLPQATGADMHADFGTEYGAYNGGENFNVHGEVVDSRDIGATVTNENLVVDISDLVDTNALVAGDLLTVHVLRDGAAVATNLYFRGARLLYR